MRPNPRRLLALTAALGLAAFLAGCATSTPGSAPPSSSGDTELEAAWLDDGRGVGIVTQGSSSCVPTAGEATYEEAESTLTVELSDPDGEACTRDLVPRGTYVGLPEGVDPAADLTIVVTGTYAGQTDLDGNAALEGVPGDETDYLPTAGWYDDPGFLILSWGSSTCAPVLEDVTANGDAELTAKFETPPDDQVCTMDIAPRVTVAAAPEEMDEDAPVQLILEGGEFDNIRIPIAAN